jgi:hypothetical protein
MAYSDIKDPSAYFQIATYTGSNNQSITNDGNSDLQPDFIWIKRYQSYEHYHLTNSSLGVNKQLLSSSNVAEQSRTDQIQSFNTDGFTLGTDAAGYTNVVGDAYVAWQWKANGGTTSTNTDGDITSTVQVNQDAGFSIVTYTGNTSNNQTVGHGLGTKPSVILIRNRTRVESWRLNHQSINNGTGMIRLNSTDAYNTTGTTLMNVAPTSSVFNVSTDWSVNGNYPFVAWCWAEKQGYSKFGAYTGISSTDGRFVYTGFKPAFVMIKRSDGVTNWRLFDNKRSGFNGDTSQLYPNLTNPEDAAGDQIDLLSNGFKNRAVSGDQNGSGQTYFYMAFAENPFVAGGIPTTAR